MRIRFNNRQWPFDLKVPQFISSVLDRSFGQVEEKAVFSFMKHMYLVNFKRAQDIEELEQILKDLSYDFQHFELNDFVQFLGQCRGRHIHLFPIPMPANTYGAWISDAEQLNEYIFYCKHLSPFQAVHTILHELSHFILGHPTTQVTLSEVKSIIAQEQTVPDTAAQRSNHSSIYEYEAETLTALIQIKTTHLPEQSNPRATSEATKLLESIGLD